MSDFDLSAYQALIPGAVQGTVSVLLGHPLDTIKTRLQAPRADVYRTPSISRTAAYMVRTEGVRSLYRGVLPPLFVTGGKRSLQFALFDRLRTSSTSTATTTKKEGPTSRSTAAAAVATIMETVQEALREILGNRFVSGSVAGVAGTVIGCPAHVIKIRTQNSTRQELKNTWSCVVHIVRGEGLRGLYCGWRAHALKDALFAGMYLGLYDLFREINTRWETNNIIAPPKQRSPSQLSTQRPQKEEGKQEVHKGKPSEPTNTKKKDKVTTVDDDWMRTARVFGCGACASVATWSLFFPLDTVKTVIQAKRGASFAEVRNVVGGGYRGLYHGLRAALLRSGPVSGVAMIAYEYTKKKTLPARQVG